MLKYLEAIQKMYLVDIKKFKKNKFSGILRITGDCPLVDIKIINNIINIFNQGKYDFVCNTMPSTFPDGLDCSIISSKVLNKVVKKINKI